MDHRKALPPGTLLSFPGMPCTLNEEIGRGSNAIVYKGTYPDLLNPGERHTVLIKELFPYHRKAAVYRDEAGRILCRPEGEETLTLHRQSFEYGNRIHLRMLEKHPELTGANINTFVLQGSMYTVLGYTGGRGLGSECPQETENLRQLTLRMIGLLDDLEAFHEGGFLHLDVAPDNILLIGRGAKERVMLIDYNSVYDRSSRQSAPTYYSVKTGYSPPEIRMGLIPSPASDLYSVSAVFYRCLTGAAMTPFQMSRPAPPDISSCTALRDQPETVASMVRQILRRGLQSLPRNRYQSAAQMREAFQELLDRIDGVGVTHWALWESGRRMVDRTVRDNPAFSFLRRKEDLFPANVYLEDGTILPASTCISEWSCQNSRAVLLTASGGMGKTTAMLRAVMSQPYSPVQPAVLYLSLYGWKDGSSSYIHNQILENLRFKPEQRSFADARHALDQLLSQPLQTRQGERPVLLLLLDGLNEASGTTQPLIEEILSLSRMPGVGLIVSTRSGEPALPFPTVSLIPLSDGESAACLSRHGLLPPQSPTMRELLRTPLMLSIFLQSSLAEQRQLPVQNQDELLDAYFAALLSKEIRALPEDTGERWKIDAAMTFVLPAIAGELQKQQRSLGDAELLPVVEKCYRLFSARLLRRAFPQWIGHSQAIRGRTGNGEEWYGQIVHDILWKRLGLLVRNSRGTYQISHQTIAEYLVILDAQNQRRIWKRRRLKLLLTAAVCILALATGTVIYTRYIRPPAYDPTYAETALTYGMEGYVDAGRQYQNIHQLVTCAIQEPENYSNALQLYTSSTSYQALDTFNDYALYVLEQTLSTGEVVPWSRKPIDADCFRELVSLAQSRAEAYAEYASVLTYVMEDEYGNRCYYGNHGDLYPTLLLNLADLDADIAVALYQIVCSPHISGKYDGASVEASDYNAVLSSAAFQNQRLIDLKAQISSEKDWMDVLRNLKALREDTLNKLMACGALSDYSESNKEYR